MSKVIGTIKVASIVTEPLFESDKSIGQMIDEMLANKHRHGEEISEVTISFPEQFVPVSVSQEEFETLQALRDGTASVQPKFGNDPLKPVRNVDRV